jgi:hypothetical protein
MLSVLLVVIRRVVAQCSLAEDAAQWQSILLAPAVVVVLPKARVLLVLLPGVVRRRLRIKEREVRRLLLWNAETSCAELSWRGSRRMQLVVVRREDTRRS